MNYQNCFAVVTKPERQEETALSPKVLVACNRDSKPKVTKPTFPLLHCTPLPPYTKQTQIKPTFYFLEGVTLLAFGTKIRTLISLPC